MNSKSEILFIGTNRGLENDLVPRSGYDLKTIEAYGLKKEISINNISHMIKTFKSVSEAKKIIEQFNPDVVIGTGGYICGPVFAAAISKKVPTVIHESNAHPGKTVKMLEKKIDKILVGFEETKKKLPKAKEVVVTGTPSKINKIEVPEEKRKEILRGLSIKNELPIVLVYGGSQGAQKINEALEELVQKGLNENYQIIWATGQKQYDIVKERFERANVYINNLKNVKIMPYIHNMEELMNISDLLVCRSGAMTITEISIVGKPAILVPLPSISANRQEDNARVLEKIGAARVILNIDINAEILSSEIDEIINNGSELKEMGRMANRVAKYNVEDKIYEEIRKTIDT